MRQGNLKENTAERIALSILRGEYPPGSTLPTETQMQATMDVSRTCLREALQILAGKGLITSRPKLGTIVRPSMDWNYLDAKMLSWRQKAMPRQVFLEELMRIRTIIEPEAVALAAVNASTEQLENIRKAHGVMVAKNGVRSPETLEADVLFHRLILSASGNALLSGLGACIEESLRSSIYATAEVNGEESKIALDQHWFVLDAMIRRAPDEAREAMTVLLSMTQNLLQELNAIT